MTVAPAQAVLGLAADVDRVALYREVGAEAAELGDVLEAVGVDRVADGRGSVGLRHHHRPLRLEVGGEAGVRGPSRWTRAGSTPRPSP